MVDKHEKVIASVNAEVNASRGLDYSSLRAPIREVMTHSNPSKNLEILARRTAALLRKSHKEVDYRVDIRLEPRGDQVFAHLEAIVTVGDQAQGRLEFERNVAKYETDAKAAAMQVEAEFKRATELLALPTADLAEALRAPQKKEDLELAASLIRISGKESTPVNYDVAFMDGDHVSCGIPRKGILPKQFMTVHEPVQVGSLDFLTSFVKLVNTKGRIYDVSFSSEFFDELKNELGTRNPLVCELSLAVGIDRKMTSSGHLVKIHTVQPSLSS